MLKAKTVLSAVLGVVLTVCGSRAEKLYDPGASDTAIKIGNTMPYSGPNSAYAIIGRTQAAYFTMINDQGGINGRKIDYISYDDSYSPPKTVEQVRKLIEGDEVLLLYSILGTPPNLAAIKYINAKKVPHLLIASGGTVFGDYKQFPWSMGFQPHTQGETFVYGRYVAENYPDARIGVLYSADGLGRDNITGFRRGLGDRASNIAVEQTYEASDPTIDSQLVKIRTSNVEVFANFATPKFAAMAIRKTAEMGWKPVHILHGISLSIENVLKPAGLENAKDIITSNYVKEFDDPTWDDDAGMKKFAAFMDKYLPGENKYNSNIAYGYMSAQTMVHILQQCGDDLTRGNVMRQAEGLREFELDLLLPGIAINTSLADHYPIEQTRMHKFDGVRWQGFGPILQLD
ncbi:ABC transporter substrate-binding protein [Bradyrhizobium ganzhouense]|uniref:ABC transporter substrate-binding protein n=1 Tax=Bradyrhizobium ganzhouense TaxID=1179767 RepID=UPI003CF56B9F